MMYVSSDYSYLEECVKGFVEDPERGLSVAVGDSVLIGVSPPKARYFFLRGQEKVPKKKATRRLGRYRDYPALLVALGLAQQAIHGQVGSCRLPVGTLRAISSCNCATRLRLRGSVKPKGLVLSVFFSPLSQAEH